MIEEKSEFLTTNVSCRADASASSGKAALGPQAERQVLLVEDHYDIRTTISSALDQSGFRVTGVGTHVAALHQVGAIEFDAFLLSRVSPDGIGLSLCHRLRRLYPHKPIVVYSTAALSMTPEQRLQAGPSAYLTDAEDILNPAGILFDLIDEATTTPSHIENKDSEVSEALLMFS